LVDRELHEEEPQRGREPVAEVRDAAGDQREGTSSRIGVPRGCERTGDERLVQVDGGRFDAVAAEPARRRAVVQVGRLLADEEQKLEPVGEVALREVVGLGERSSQAPILERPLERGLG
jgi:hypothetical protein